MRQVQVSSPDGTPAVGALVSDGTEVARTDRDGRAWLPARGPFVHLVSRVPGAGDVWYLPADATELRFTTSAWEPAPVTFAHVTDLHVTDPHAPSRPRGFTVADDRMAVELARMEAPATEQMAAELFARLPVLAPDARFAVATGDLTDRASDVEFTAYRRASEGPLPVLDVPGNHDHRIDDDGCLEVTAYERHLGPRWYSLDVAGVHLVVLDWFSWTLRRDDRQQRAWLHADLELAGDRPWVLFTHDRIRDLDLTTLRRPPVATFTGHWHATRVLHHGGTAHVATGSPLFAGLDRSVPLLREATVSDRGLTLRTVATPTATPLSGATRRSGTAGSDRLTPMVDAEQEPIGWSRALAGTGTAAAPVAAGNLAVLLAVDEDRGPTEVVALDPATGEDVWRVSVPEPVRGRPAVHGDTIVLASVSGALCCLDVATGRRRWLRPAFDPLLGWVTNGPSIGPGSVVSGDASGVMACALDDGSTRWQRRDLAQHLNHVSYSAPTVIGRYVVAGFWPQAPGLVVLDAATGTVCSPPAAERLAAEAGWGEGIPSAPRADLVGLEEEVLVLEAGRLVRRDLPGRTERWSVPAPGLFAVAPPVVVDDLVLLVDHGVALDARESATGRLRWSYRQPERFALPQLPYAPVGAALTHAPAIGEGLVALTLGDGRVVVLDLPSGTVLGGGQVPDLLLQGGTAVGGTLVTVDLHGVARGAPLDGLRSPHPVPVGAGVQA